MFLISSHTGVIIVDEVCFYKGNLEIIVFNTGDTVTIRDQIGDTVVIEYDGEAGTLLKGVLVNAGDSLAAEQIYVFARGYYDGHKYAQAARLFTVFLDLYPGSPYFQEALLYTGITLEELARDGEMYDTIPGITFNQSTKRYYYAGVVYKHLLETYPEGRHAAQAAYRYILAVNAADQPWGESVDRITRTLKRWKDFISTYTSCEEHALALSEIGYIYRALFEITEEKQYKEKARSTFKTLINAYPGTVHEASARINLFELQEGIPIYLY